MAATTTSPRTAATHARIRRLKLVAICACLLGEGLGRLAAQQVPPAAPAPVTPPAAPAAPASAAPHTASELPTAPAPFTENIPGTLVRFEMVPIGDLWMSATEVTWDAYDVFVFGLDKPETPASPAAATPGESSAPASVPASSPAPAPAPATAAPPAPDAVVRPTKPHMVTDRGFGHAGYPAISMNCKGAQAFCTWLSGVTGRRYRLPTEAEWEAACRAGASSATSAWNCGDDAACLDTVAWYRVNADHKTHPVASKAPSAAGLYDMHGNVAEWCLAPDGSGAVRGGSFRDASKDLRCDARVLPVPAWNQSDPNLPKSVWWLADASFVGFRIVCEDAPAR